MPSNIEIKARVKSLDRLRSAAARLAAEPPQTLRQEDIFFRCANGRLKLRILSETAGELICYERPDTPGAKRSRYRICRTSEPQALREVLSRALGETAVVRKTREVYIVGQTRIHLDEVETLGTFVELEVVLGPDQTLEQGRGIADDLMRKMSIRRSDLVPCAYADLLDGKARRGSPT